jgi:hypothetical protein
LFRCAGARSFRGDEKSDYWCFADGFCFYAIARFRILYPAYNDLEDDVLLAELRAKGAPRRRRRSRAGPSERHVHRRDDYLALYPPRDVIKYKQ